MDGESSLTYYPKTCSVHFYVELLQNMAQPGSFPTVLTSRSRLFENGRCATRVKRGFALVFQSCAFYRSPRNLFVAGFIVRECDEMGNSLVLQNGLALRGLARAGALDMGDAVTLGIRSEHFALQNTGGMAAR